MTSYCLHIFGSKKCIKRQVCRLREGLASAKSAGRTGVVLRRLLKGSVDDVKAMHTAKAKKGRDSERKHKTEKVRAK